MLALVKAAPLKPEIRLAEAVSQFEAELSSEQKATFRCHRAQSLKIPPGISDVMQLVADIQTPNGIKSGFNQCFGPRLINILESIQRYAALGDVVVGGSQNIIACGVWALARVTLLSVAQLPSFLDKLSTLLMRAGRSAPRYERMALLYPQSRVLQSHLSEYLIVFVRIFQKAFNFASKSALRQLISAVADSELDNHELELKRWASSIKEEVALLSFEEQKVHFGGLLKHSKLEAKRRHLNARCRILDHCSTYDYQTSWKQLRKKGNTSLLQNNTKYESWKSSSASSTLICLGKLGCGKSVLLANMIEDLSRQSQGTKSSTAYFFCRHDISESLLAFTVIGSLVRQLLQSIADLSEIEDVVDNDTFDHDPAALCDLLIRALPVGLPAKIVLDGLDECEVSQADTIITQISRLQNVLSLRLCISFRAEALHLTRLNTELFTVPHTTLLFPPDNPDITMFISEELERRLIAQRLILGDPTLIVEIHDTLLAAAQGMFLWVILQIESLCAARTDEIIRTILKKLPKDLPETFSRILQAAGMSDQQYQTRTLELLIAASRPLNTEEFREALSVVPGDTTWKASGIVNDVHSVLATCGCLITVDEEDFTVALIHHSVKQFLLDAYETPSGVKFSEEAAQRAFSGIVVTYLNYGIFDTQLSRAETSTPNIEVTPSRIVQSMEVPRTIRAAALYMLRARKQQSRDLANALETAYKQMNVPNTHRHPFLNYAKSNWLRHACLITQKDSVNYDLLLKLLKCQVVDVEDKDQNGRTLLLWAAEKGSVAVVNVLIEKGAFIETHDSQSDTALLLAARNLHLEITELLLNGGAELEDQHGCSALNAAAERGGVEIAELIIKRKDGLRSSAIQKALFQAAINGQERVVQFFIQNRSCYAFSVGSGAILLAAEAEHESIVELLVNYDAHFQGDDQGQKALLVAAKRGLHATAKLLLEKGVRPTGRDSSGQTALALAANGRHTAIVRLLLSSSSVFIAKNAEELLLLATDSGNCVIIRQLLFGGLKVDNKSGQEALLLAALRRHRAVVHLLASAGVSIPGSDQTNVITTASEFSFEVLIRNLEDEGITISAVLDGVASAYATGLDGTCDDVHHKRHFAINKKGKGR